MTNKVKFSIIIAISASIAMNSCGGGGNTDKKSNDVTVTSIADNKMSDSKKNQLLFKVKQGTMVFDLFGGGYKKTVYFDDYGAKLRVVDKYFFSIFDENAKIAIKFNPGAMTYEELEMSDLYIELGGLSTRLTDADAAKGGIELSKENIAGKECSVFTVETGGRKYITGSYNGLIFLTAIGDDISIKVISFDETVPENIFEIPDGYTKEN